MLEILHNFVPQPIAFQLGFITIHWYGLFVVGGMVAALLVASKLAGKLGIARDDVWDLAFYVVIFGLLGARTYAVLLELPYYLAHPDQIIAIWNGGIAIHGALIGGALAVVYFARKKNVSAWLYADLLAVVIPLGQAIGRWGNYFNQELFGKPTDAAWGIPIDALHRPAAYSNVTHFHPTFLYESVLNLVNFGVLLFLFRRAYSTNHETGNTKQETGIMKHGKGLIFVYLINYALIRIAMELVRIDRTPALFGIRVPILVSVGILVLGIVGLWWKQQFDTRKLNHV
ncbi:MAG: prolipoprotein diacylglyceryl transferase [Candidatus Buchananbacteria bacterium RIFCSPHIGHO2_01_FULL_47_11b]|uniref:Phosphatidylglycerol--prolipoprotein diacylglyceryl transferase n=1 Tax=Candidatus Buchananbacteria bacterium RIFCSPHIGHO2_01_FULL_47_11b TaxID=1797537 RepID=A0A1G1Y6D0_9BACT|nr:MAG: prolipoprotein diacylglyceryl transferase [Candidatus Buchananbacteria bacterium RIFCSPHIGHO2_01_FULL_47_11b]